MLVPIEAKPHIMSWLNSSRIGRIEGTEVTVMQTDDRDLKTDYFRVFFPGVVIEDVHNLTDLQRLGKEQPMPCDCDVWPSDKTGWLIIKGYLSDDVVFVGHFYSEEQFSRACREVAEYKHARLEPFDESLQGEKKRNKRLQESVETAASADAERSADESYRIANGFYERGDFEKAIDLYSEAIKNACEGDPQRYKYCYNRGLALCCLERYTEGKIDIMKVLELKPDFQEGWYILGLAKEYLNDIDGALEAYERALKLNPDFKDAQNRKELAESKKRKSHSNLLSKASSSKGDSQEYAATLEEIKELSNEGEFEKALKLAEEALRKDPDDFQLLLSKRVLVGKIGTARELCGLDEVKDMLDMLIVHKIRNPNNPLYRAGIAQGSIGIILHGPPGCGKTAIVVDTAKREGIKLVEVVLSEIMNMWSGESEKRITRIFETVKDIARSGKPVILFIDELDALGIARSVTIESIEGSWSRDLRNTFRRLFGEVENIPNLAIVGATNYIWSVDDALKREGRMGTCIIYVPPPDAKVREEIFRLYSKETPGHETVDFRRLAESAKWSSPADIRKVCKKAHFALARKITMGKRDAVATTEDYEHYLKNEISTTLSWIRSVARAWAEGKIKDDELDPRLLSEIDLLDPTAKIKREEAKSIEERDRSFRPVYVK